jgi:peptidoglycan/xylan/chitin deacetylase (PgdA/CDA1 family)
VLLSKYPKTVVFSVAMFGCGLVACLAVARPPEGAQPDGRGMIPFRGGKFEWPPGTLAAVTLTYDDALPSHLGIAAPALDRHHLRGTFFLTEGASGEVEQWRALHLRGHELASHTMRHPCDGAEPWVPKGRALQDYDLARMDAELDESLALLRALGATTAPYTFAYPCGATWIGAARDSYVPLVERRFIAARGVSPGLVDPATETFQSTPAISADKRADGLVGLVEEASRRAGWLVIVFHGVGGDYLSVSAEAHEALLGYLDARRSDIWTETFASVASYIQSHRPPQ